MTVCGTRNRHLDRVAGPPHHHRRRVFWLTGPPKETSSLALKNPYLRGGRDNSLITAAAEALNQVPVLELVAAEV